MLVGLHVVLSVGLACLFTPCFTTALNPLPPYLYSHGSAILATLQQVAGAAGTALLVAIMAGSSLKLTQAGVPQLAALNGGIHAAFSVAAVISIGALICSFFMKNPVPDEAATPTTSADDFDVELSAPDRPVEPQPQRHPHLEATRGRQVAQVEDVAPAEFPGQS
jgi:DHA2 family lincomycin resistance protein-like MFS transporter